MNSWAAYESFQNDCRSVKSWDIPFLSNSTYFTLQEKWRGKCFVMNDEEAKLTMKLVENTNEPGRWRHTRDFPQRGFAVYYGMVYLSWESVYKIDFVFFWRLVLLPCLSVSNQRWWCSKDFMIWRELWPTLTFPHLAVHFLEPISLPLPTIAE